MGNVSEKLAAIFQNVNDWLRFAEAKNAVLFAFAGAGITAIITLLTTAQNLPNSLQVGFLITACLLCLCALICSLSFLPKVNWESLSWTRTRPSKNSSFQPRDTDNFYYFGHLQKYHPTQLIDALNKHYFDNQLNPPYKKEYEDLASPITINAEITFLKFRFFTFALYFLLASILAVPFSILLSLIIKRSL